MDTVFSIRIKTRELLFFCSSRRSIFGYTCNIAPLGITLKSPHRNRCNCRKCRLCPNRNPRPSSTPSPTRRAPSPPRWHAIPLHVRARTARRGSGGGSCAVFDIDTRLVEMGVEAFRPEGARVAAIGLVVPEIHQSRTKDGRQIRRNKSIFQLLLLLLLELLYDDTHFLPLVSQASKEDT